MTSWELIFLHSKVNDGFYDEARLPDLKWDWPRETWLQERLRHLRKLRSSMKHWEREIPGPQGAAQPANGDCDEVQTMHG
jgi:hypothetical protein